MQNVTVRDVLTATNGELLQGDADTLLNEICINSREVKIGDLFVPIIGERVDGHRFINGALGDGACATLTSEDGVPEGAPVDKTIIKVEDTVAALQAIGRFVRNRVNLPVVAVTGSVGKTTTREMITAALKTDRKVFHTEKNFNSQIGVPITLSKLAKEDEIAVLECGMSEPGQIHVLSSMVRPNYCVVTTIGVAHIEFLKTQENIRTEKLHIIDCMTEDGILFLNGDDSMLAEMRGKMPCKTLFYGLAENCDYRAINVHADSRHTYFDCVHGEESIPVVLNVLGNHNVGNALAAIGVAHEAGIPMAKAATGFLSFEGQRQRIVEGKNGITIIDDTYNASPTSMKASISVACEYPKAGKCYLVLGDMFELGENENQYHEEVGHFIAGQKADVVVTVGQLAKYIGSALQMDQTKVQIVNKENNAEAVAYLQSVMQPGDLMLVKGSNGMKMNEIVKALSE